MTLLLAFILAAPVRWLKLPSPKPPVACVCGIKKSAQKRRKRVRRVTYRKPPTVWVYPDKVEVLSYAEFWAMERAKMKALAAWCVGRTIQALP